MFCLPFLFPLFCKTKLNKSFSIRLFTTSRSLRMNEWKELKYEFKIGKNLDFLLFYMCIDLFILQDFLIRRDTLITCRHGSLLLCVASPHNVICSDLCTGFKNVKTWRVSNPRRVSLLLELISQVYVTATPSRLSLLNLAIHRVVRECIVLLLCWQVNTHARLFVIYVRYIYDTTLCLLRVWKVVLFSGVISFQSLSVFLEACPP